MRVAATQLKRETPMDLAVSNHNSTIVRLLSKIPDLVHDSAWKLRSQPRRKHTLRHAALSPLVHRALPFVNNIALDQSAFDDRDLDAHSDFRASVVDARANASMRSNHARSLRRRPLKLNDPLGGSRRTEESSGIVTNVSDNVPVAFNLNVYSTAHAAGNCNKQPRQPKHEIAEGRSTSPNVQARDILRLKGVLSGLLRADSMHTRSSTGQGTKRNRNPNSSNTGFMKALLEHQHQARIATAFSTQRDSFVENMQSRKASGRSRDECRARKNIAKSEAVGRAAGHGT